ncbi:PIG-L family deacetylase [Helcobacillus sp. ACRRO]|uniref:PIG-L deacetylase family protein n=1 Tax=Helcobacillus sp. ACRRO TaxID=2918202 RepID=UPI001EF54919|nr:PIG-L family deacetylase [Helcobacillus sp. ACRRO]MCG7427505.1 PIG-L family deacetylase [Helcobacillus sp. ACRRO]
MMSPDDRTPENLPVFDSSGMSRVLVVVAHPDDAEYGLSCAVNRWTRSGIEVSYLLLTHGEAGIRTMHPSEAGPVRAEEQRRACAAVGVSDLAILDHPDGMMEPTLQLRRDIAERIRVVQPDTVVTANFDVEAYGGFNQADHRVAGLAAVDAVSAADNPWVFTDLELKPHKVSRILIHGAAAPTHRIELEEEDVQAGITSLAAYEAYFEALPDHPKPEPFIRSMVEPHGLMIRVQDLR